MTTTTILSFFVILFCLMSQANAWESWNITDPDSGLPCLTLETDAIEFMLRYNESNKTHAYTAKLIKTISMKGNCSVFHNNATYSIIEVFLFFRQTTQLILQAIILVRTNEHDAVHESWTVKFWFQKMDDTTMKKSRNIRGYREDYGFLNAFNLARYELITASTKESPHPSNISYAELERLDMRDSQLDNGIKCSELMLLFSDNSMITFRGLDFFILVKNDDGHYVVHRIYNLCSMDQELIAYSTSDFLAIGVIVGFIFLLCRYCFIRDDDN
ncbi:hypothetical protein WR25_22711 [Diploscapter pachys]|uniref:Uncharacterized protein n=1 Tax=Diploscapter pachys TaxID=2018661 RepID=A0A2A2M115_9BILA|nr:hypothetical protein WR25_22711 [Diploscapter pachys]